MQNKNDQYQVYIDENKTVYYYKNKELHRENGPAIVKAEERNSDRVEDDQGLYSITFKPVLKKSHVINDPDVVQIQLGNKVKNLLETLRTEKNSIISLSQESKTYSDSPYFLDGLNYSKSEFESIVLKNHSRNNSSRNLKN